MNLRYFIILLCSLLFACSPSEPVFHDNENKTVQFSQLKGKWVVINYWALWCHNCLKEIPELNHFYQHNKDKNVILLGVNFDNSNDLSAAIKKSGIQFPVLQEDPSQYLNLGTAEAIPMTVIMDPQGKVVKKILGVNTERSLSDTLHALQQ